MVNTAPSTIKERYARTLEEIGKAAGRSGRTAGEIKLVTVTKAQPIEVVRAAIEAGATILGENYAEEAVKKIETIHSGSVQWHMIGHIQSRKAELVAGHFDMVHSLESTKLAGRLERVCVETGRKLPVLLEFNVSGEESKSGLPAWDEQSQNFILPEIEKILACQHLEVQGLMTMPPYFEDPERSRPYFQRLRQMQKSLADHFPQFGWQELSMGTSGDFKVAIEEGATYVRIGRSILGPRPADL